MRIFGKLVRQVCWSEAARKLFTKLINARQPAPLFAVKYFATLKSQAAKYTQESERGYSAQF